MRFSSQAVHGHWCGSRVFPVKCRYCGQKIFLFTCNCGSRVLFDDLGHPWPKHYCSEYYATRSVSDTELDLHAPLSVQEPSIDEIDPEFLENVSRKKDWAAPIVKISPDDNNVQQVSGIVREINHGIDPFKKLKLAKGSLGAVQLAKMLPAEISQITVHAGGIANDQIESYTFWVSHKHFSKKEMTKGRVIFLRLKPVQQLGAKAFWLAEEIQFLDH